MQRPEHRHVFQAFDLQAHVQQAADIQKGVMAVHRRDGVGQSDRRVIAQDRIQKDTNRARPSAQPDWRPLLDEHVDDMFRRRSRFRFEDRWFRQTFPPAAFARRRKNVTLRPMCKRPRRRKSAGFFHRAGIDSEQRVKRADPHQPGQQRDQADIAQRGLRPDKDQRQHAKPYDDRNTRSIAPSFGFMSDLLAACAADG